MYRYFVVRVTEIQTLFTSPILDNSIEYSRYKLMFAE